MPPNVDLFFGARPTVAHPLNSTGRGVLGTGGGTRLFRVADLKGGNSSFFGTRYKSPLRLVLSLIHI